MASEANLRTALSLCDPTELAQVRRVAINEALFCVYDSAWHRQTPCHRDDPFHNTHHQQQNTLLHTPPTTPLVDQHQHRRQYQETNTTSPIARPLTPPSPLPLPLLLPPSAAASMTHTSVATSLLVDILRLVSARLLGLQELVLVPRDENPLYSSDCYLTEPAMGQNRLRRQVSEAIAVTFAGGGGGTDNGGGDTLDRSSHPSALTSMPPWEWKIRTLSADPDPPSYDKLVLGWCGASADSAGVEGKDSRGGGMTAATGATGATTTRLSAVQESARMILEKEMEIDEQ
jgi:hypothetical protein